MLNQLKQTFCEYGHFCYSQSMCYASLGGIMTLHIFLDFKNALTDDHFV